MAHKMKEKTKEEKRENISTRTIVAVAVRYLFVRAKRYVVVACVAAHGVINNISEGQSKSSDDLWLMPLKTNWRPQRDPGWSTGNGATRTVCDTDLGLFCSVL